MEVSVFFFAEIIVEHIPWQGIDIVPMGLKRSVIREVDLGATHFSMKNIIAKLLQQHFLVLQQI